MPPGPRRLHGGVYKSIKERNTPAKKFGVTKVFGGIAKLNGGLV